jgi:integrase
MSKDTRGMYKRNEIWWFHYSHNGKQYRQSSKTKNFQGAVEYKKKFIELLKTPININTTNTGNNYSLDFIIQKFFEEKDRICRPHTIKLYEIHSKYILSFFKAGTLIKDIKKIDIKNYENYRLINGANESLVLIELLFLKNIFNFAVENELLDYNIFNNYNFNKIYKKYKPRERFLTPDECMTLINNCNQYLQRLVKFILETGTRINETLNLYFSDIATEQKSKIQYVRIRKEISKSKKERFIPLTKEAMEQVNKQKIDFPNSMFIFTDKYGKAYKTNPRNSFNRATKKSNLQHVGFHTLRHTFASQKLQGINYRGEKIKPVRIEIIAEVLGHTNINLTKKVYAIFDKENMMIEFLDNDREKN